LFELEERQGGDVIRKLYFHLLAFEANKAGSLAPTEVDVPGANADVARRFALDVLSAGSQTMTETHLS
jgi:hypothetical protein